MATSAPAIQATSTTATTTTPRRTSACTSIGSWGSVTDLVLSASSVDTFRKCGYRWYLQYVERHEGDQNVRAAVGLAVHQGAQTYYELKRLGIPHEVLVGELWEGADGILAIHDRMLISELF